jgi:phospholipid/cholesterol/gamma-HCH transport system substrate-binding protein
MAQKHVSWAQLRVGLLVLVSLTVLAATVFLMTGEGLFTRKSRIRVFIDNAGGLKKGNPVRLTGIDIGNIEEIRVSGESDPNRAVLVIGRIYGSYLDDIRQDSVATLEADGLLGQRYIDITRGAPGSPKIEPNAEVKYRLSPGVGDVIASGATALTNMNRLVNSFTRVAERIEKGEGSLGKFLTDEDLYRNAEAAVQDFRQVAASVAGGEGTLGKLLTDDEMYQRANDAIGKLNTMVDDVRGGKGTLGKLVGDTEIYDEARQMVARANEIVADVKAGKGTLGRLITDDAFYTRATTAVDKFAALGERLDRGEGSFGKFVRDEAFYNNTNTLALEVRELIADFRKNPKKFLTIQLKLF